jgi:hypothetical protein
VVQPDGPSDALLYNISEVALEVEIRRGNKIFEIRVTSNDELSWNGPRPRKDTESLLT